MGTSDIQKPNKNTLNTPLLPFVYHPYKSYQYVVPMMIGFCILGFITVGMNIFQSKDFTIFGLVIGTIFLFAAIYSSRRANTVIVFDADGLHITMGTRNYYQFVPWDSLQYAYSARNIKGFQFLILSPMPLNKSKIDKYVWEGSDGKRIYLDSVMVIHLWSAKEIAKIEELVSQQGLKIEKQ